MVVLERLNGSCNSTQGQILCFLWLLSFVPISNHAAQAAMSEAKEDGKGHGDRALSSVPTDTSNRPRSVVSFRRIPSARQPELSQIPEDTAPVVRRKEHVGTEKDRVHNTNYTDENINPLGGGGDSMELSSKRDDSHIREQPLSQRSLLSDSSSHQLDALAIDNDNDADSSSVVSRRSGRSFYSLVAGASDWSIGVEPEDSKVSSLVRQWEVIIPTAKQSSWFLHQEEEKKDVKKWDDGNNLTESALERLSQQDQQLSDGLVGRFSMATVNSNTTKAEQIAHEMEVTMAWWRDHGLDMKASGDSPVEMPEPFSTLEDEAKGLPSSSNHKDWWNRHHEFEDDKSDAPGKIAHGVCQPNDISGLDVLISVGTTVGIMCGVVITLTT